jgi:3-hydroxypropanoate dehydrogenase
MNNFGKIRYKKDTIMDAAHIEKQLFTEARTHRSFTSKKIDDSILHKIYELAKFGPTANNACPMRLTFVKSPEAKQKLIEVASEGNRPKIKSSPVTIILAYDIDYYKQIPLLAPHMNAAKIQAQPKEERDKFARELSWLQAGYVIIAARHLGLDCGTMGGFDRAGTDNEFYLGTSWRSNILINLGYGDNETLRERAPRLDFDDACQFL